LFWPPEQIQLAAAGVKDRNMLQIAIESRIEAIMKIFSTVFSLYLP
jgi:hypothetical protein